MEHVDFSGLDLPRNSNSYQKENTLFVENWNWDYLEFLEYQKSFQDFVRRKRKSKIYVFTNHPHCFTLGRGNERGVSDLKNFNPIEAENLEFPVYKVHRGGGITFHYPGQWIFYPILALTPRYSLSDHMCWQLKVVKEFLIKEFKLNAIATEKIMGVWIEKRKIASIGVGLSKFITEHGIAFNVNRDVRMETERSKIQPCGLAAETYTFLNEELSIKSMDILDLHKKIIKLLS